jgi:hypothetical protein
MKRIIDAVGRMIHEEKIISSQQELNISNLPNGIYSLCFYGNHSTIKTIKFSVQH